MTFDDTAISNHDIGYLRAENISGWVIITDLGVDRVWGKECIQILIIKELHILFKVRPHITDTGSISLSKPVRVQKQC